MEAIYRLYTPQSFPLALYVYKDGILAIGIGTKGAHQID